ncbi:GNAT family N-acetyltransferase [Pseudonocardia sp. TRM90224]|uniref:GNAT family N-acetyltransferase n=1 Tax=Pseudonocardia sp. TRM90224 TaxID=2812678 RepID=UPI001E488F7C|nr:GNAT family N-acetyltransferase [Pseudonocardia sp. TRM90224]
MHVELEDRPGRLGELATAVGTAGCNIISLHVVGEPADDGSVTDELLVKVPAGIEAGTLVDAVRQAGIPCTLLVRADATELSDPATTALALARMVAADPGSAPRAVATMLRARLVDPEASPGGTTDDAYVTRIGAHQLQIGRAWPFTATELSRAAALLELAGQLELRGNHRPGADDRVMVLRDGSEVRLRHVAPGDGPLVAALHARCSPEVRRARFLAPAPQLPAAELAMLLGSPHGHALLAVTTDGGSAVGLANLEPHTPGAARICALVEDAWQGRGLGTALLRRLVDIGAAEGVTQLVGVARPADVGVTRLLRRAGLRPSAELVGDEVHLRARHHTR